jgi:hypothetical protein
MNLAIILGALLCLAPHTPEKRAAMHASIIQRIASTDDEAAALLVTGTRESDWRVGCVQGIGGAGTYGLGHGYKRWACAPLKIQALMSLQAYQDKGAPDAWHHAIIGYLGARTIQEPEARRRIAMFEVTRERLACACCL